MTCFLCKSIKQINEIKYFFNIVPDILKELSSIKFKLSMILKNELIIERIYKFMNGLRNLSFEEVITYFKYIEYNKAKERHDKLIPYFNFFLDHYDEFVKSPEIFFKRSQLTPEMEARELALYNQFCRENLFAFKPQYSNQNMDDYLKDLNLYQSEANLNTKCENLSKFIYQPYYKEYFYF